MKVTTKDLLMVDCLVVTKESRWDRTSELETDVMMEPTMVRYLDSSTAG